MAGLQPNLVRLEPYDSSWPHRFAQEADALRLALAPHILQIEHIGSTAIPGLDAKPILDIAILIPSLNKLPELETALQKAGYTSKGEFGLPGRHFFTKGDPVCFHVHVVETGSEHWTNWLIFRNALRADAGLRNDYLHHKQELAAKFAADRAAYTAAKTGFIARVIARAPMRS